MAAFEFRNYKTLILAGISIVVLTVGCVRGSVSDVSTLEDLETQPPIAIEETLNGYTSCLELDLDAIGSNLNAIRERTGVDVMPVVKNNAYGHGLVPIVRYLTEQGVQRVFVVNVQEALDLRQAGLDVGIVNMGPLFTDNQYAKVVELGITQVVFSDDVVQRLSDAAQGASQEARVFVKVDTGLRRIGISHEHAADFIERTASLPRITVEGIFSTFMEASNDQDREMLSRLLAVEDDVRERGIDPGLRSMASTGAILHLPDSYLDLVRPGLSLYGIYSEATDIEAGMPLTPALSLKARIELVKWVNEGDSVTYFGGFIAPHRMMIATVHAGFYDGVPRELSNAGAIFFAGEFRNIIGWVSLNHLIIDVTGTEAESGDVVEVIGPEGPNTVSAMAQTANWSVYSLLNHLNANTPRVYYQDDELAELMAP